MKHQLVYLAGAITGLSYGAATDWRDQVRETVAGTHIHTLSPLRGKQYLEKRVGTGVIGTSYEEFPLSSAKGINVRDHWDVSRSDVIFVNLLGTQKVSIGTVMEIAWAFAYRKPVILIMEEQGNPHEHAMIRESIGFRISNLETGIEILKAICGPDSTL